MAMLGETNYRMGNLEVRQSKLERSRPTVEETRQENLQLLEQLLEGKSEREKEIH